MAVIIAILVMLLVAGSVALSYLASSTRRDDDRANRARAHSEALLLAAGTDIAGRLERWELGRDVKRASRFGYAYWGVPGIAAGAAKAGPYAINDSRRRQVGQYWILRPPAGYCSGGAGSRNCGPGGYLNTDPASPNRGTVTVFVEGHARFGERLERVRITYKRNSLAQFAVLSDQKIDIGGMGNVTLPTGSAIHSNNVDGEADAIVLASGTRVVSAAKRITARAGRIRNCRTGNRCTITGRVVPFSSVDVSFNRVVSDFVRGGSTCAGRQTCVIRANTLTGGGTTMPMFRARLTGGCALLYRTQAPLRQGVGYPVIDDRTQPPAGASLGRYCPPEGGGAILFEGDVQVEGSLNLRSAPLTVMARRPANFPAVSVLGRSTRVADPAAIYLVTQGGSVGGRPAPNANQLPTPLGIVSQGGVYVPTWSVQSANINIQHVSIVAAGGGFSIGPTFMNNTAEEGYTAYQRGGGRSACGLPSNDMPLGGRVTFSGTVASRQKTFFTYQTGGCYKGFSQRTFSFDDTLGWYPLPYFPAPDPWHVVDWQEHRGA